VNIVDSEEGVSVESEGNNELERGGNDRAKAYALVHFMPDPLRGNGCELVGCDEFKNRACVRSYEKDGEFRKKCVNVTETVLDWSDVTAFVFFGNMLEIGSPVDVHTIQNISSWSGPFSVVLARDLPSGVQQKRGVQNLREGSRELVDRYVTRYVETPLTSLLRPGSNPTLYAPKEWSKFIGPEAVKETIQAQFSIKSGDDSWSSDPFEKYVNNCDKGDVKPLLPLFQFDFMQNKETGSETIDVKVKFKVITTSNEENPQLHGRFRHWKDVGFHVSGPYCWGKIRLRNSGFLPKCCKTSLDI